MLRRAGYRDITVFERGERVGGVWNLNTYPGIACDVPSHLYEFSFAPNPDWTRRYSPGHEIQAYLEGVAARRRRARPRPPQHRGHRARASTRTASAGCSRRAPATHEADVLITACGQLSVPTIPPIAGHRRLRGPELPHRRVGPRRRPDGQARGDRRHRLQHDPGRARRSSPTSPSSTSTSARRAGRSRRWTTPTRSGRRSSSRASRPCSGSIAWRRSRSWTSAPPR